MLSIEEKVHSRFALLHLGFRPFFILGLVSAVLLMTLWMFFYKNGYRPAQFQMHPTSIWHAHEMIYGYTLAIISGFLLTAVKNWTGVQTASGTALALPVIFWLAARCLAFVHGSQVIYLMAMFDLAFNSLCVIYILMPIARAQQWRQTGIWLIVLLMSVSHLLFYLGLMQVYPPGLHIGLYAGLYLVIMLLLVMARRVVPFFIEKGTPGNFVPVNHLVLDLLIIAIMTVFALSELSNAPAGFTALVSLNLGVLCAWQLKGWYTHEVWKKPLLWSLVIAYTWLITGFILRFTELSGLLDSALSLHAFAYGGAGLMTASMLCRVSLGHTGRDVFNPPRLINPLLLVLSFGCISRVILPLIFPSAYAQWVAITQACWIISFTGLSLIYIPMLYKPRVDGRYG